MDRADRIRPCEVCVLDDALRSGATTADPEGAAAAKETLSTAQRFQIWANRPFERPGMNALRPRRRAWAGRSTPIRYADNASDSAV
jgi:hypothetical protein